MRRLALVSQVCGLTFGLVCGWPVETFAAPEDTEVLAPLTPGPSRRPARGVRRRAAGKPATLAVQLEKPIEGAHLFIDEQDRGALPLPPQELAPGPHHLSVRRSGFKEATQRLNLIAGERKDWTVDLEAIAGVLRVRGTPPGAQVLVDGLLVGELPRMERVLAPGPYKLTVRAAGHVQITTPLLMRAGRDEVKEIALAVAPADGPVAEQPSEPSVPSAALPGAPGDEAPVATVSEGGTPFFSRWYVWVGLTVVVAGAAAGGWAIAQAARPGTPPPSQVCAGTCDAILNAPVGF